MHKFSTGRKFVRYRMNSGLKPLVKSRNGKRRAFLRKVLTHKIITFQVCVPFGESKKRIFDRRDLPDFEAETSAKS